MRGPAWYGGFIAKTSENAQLAAAIVAIQRISFSNSLEKQKKLLKHKIAVGPHQIGAPPSGETTFKRVKLPKYSRIPSHPSELKEY